MMRNAIWSGICTAVLLTTTVAMHAQQPPGAAQPPTPSTPPSTAPPPATQPPTSAPPAAATQDSANKITVTGCLQAAPGGPTGTTGASASAEKFVLTNITPNSNDAAGAKTTSTVRSYRLVANDEALAPHAGKKIEVTGTLDNQASTSPGSSSASSASSASANDAPRLIVESAKIIAPTCTD